MQKVEVGKNIIKEKTDPEWIWKIPSRLVKYKFLKEYLSIL